MRLSPLGLHESLFCRLLYHLLPLIPSRSIKACSPQIKKLYLGVNFSVKNMFRGKNRACAYVNESKYELTRHWARYTWCAMRYDEKQCESAGRKPDRPVEITSDPLKWLSLHSEYKNCNMDYENFCKSDESSKEVPNYISDVAERQTGLCSSSNTFKIEKLTSTLHQDEFESKLIRDPLSSVVYCNRINISGWTRSLVGAEFESKL